MFQKLRLSTLITLAVCTTVALTVALQLTLVNHFAVRHAGMEAELRLQQLSWQMRDSLNRIVEQAAGDARLLAALPAVRQAHDPASARGVLDSLQRTFPDYAWIGIAATDGTVTTSTKALLEGATVGGRPWFQAACTACAPPIIIRPSCSTDCCRAGPIRGASSTCPRPCSAWTASCRACSACT